MAFDILGVFNGIGKKIHGKNENNDLRDMVRSTSKYEGRRVKVRLHSKTVSKRFPASSLNNSIADSLGTTQVLSR